MSPTGHPALALSYLSALVKTDTFNQVHNACMQCTRDNYNNLSIGYLPSQIASLSDNNEVWSDRLSDQRIRREPKGLSCICLVD